MNELVSLSSIYNRKHIASKSKMATKSLKNISLFIPRVFKNINENKIIDIFENTLTVGKINRVDVLDVENENYNRIFIHFDYWYPTEKAMSIQNDLIYKNEKNVKVYYDKLWYWLVVVNKTIEPTENNIFDSYEDSMNMKKIEQVLSQQEGKEEGKGHYLETYETYENDDYDYDIETDYTNENNYYTKEDYDKMDDLEDNYFDDGKTLYHTPLNTGFMDYVHRDYVEKLEYENTMLKHTLMNLNM